MKFLSNVDNSGCGTRWSVGAWRSRESKLMAWINSVELKVGGGPVHAAQLAAVVSVFHARSDALVVQLDVDGTGENQVRIRNFNSSVRRGCRSPALPNY